MTASRKISQVRLRAAQVREELMRLQRLMTELKEGAAGEELFLATCILEDYRKLLLKVGRLL